MKNVKTIKITVPNDTALSLVNRTPTLKQLVRQTLNVGENVENVNHYQYSRILAMFPSIGITVIDL